MLTPEQARDLVKHFGGQWAAARGVDVPSSTLAHWLNPEINRARFRARFRANREAELAEQRDRYHAETGLQRAHRQLRMRRTKALHRRAEREQRRTSG